MKNTKIKLEDKYIVINRKHLEELTKKSFGIKSKFIPMLNEIINMLPKNDYYVCNADESYADQILKRILSGEKAKAAGISGAEDYMFLDAKHFLVMSRFSENAFYAFESRSGSIISLEYVDIGIPPATMCEWNTRADMVKGITWLDWIIEGIQDEELRKAVEALNET